MGVSWPVEWRRFITRATRLADLRPGVLATWYPVGVWRSWVFLRGLGWCGRGGDRLGGLVGELLGGDRGLIGGQAGGERCRRGQESAHVEHGGFQGGGVVCVGPHLPVGLLAESAVVLDLLAVEHMDDLVAVGIDGPHVPRERFPAAAAVGDRGVWP